MIIYILELWIYFLIYVMNVNTTEFVFIQYETNNCIKNNTITGFTYRNADITTNR